MPSYDILRSRAKDLRLLAILAHWEEYSQQPWLPLFLEREEEERQARSLKRRLCGAKVGNFKPLPDFDWAWPEQIDREQIEGFFSLEFLKDGTNLVLIGPNGVGKTMIAQNLTNHAVLHGHTAQFTTASKLLNDLSSQDGPTARLRRLHYYCKPKLLAIDEVGYLSYDSQYADLLFEVISRRNLEKSTLVTTNRAFSEWQEVFPNATSVVALIDRLIHRSEITEIKGKSFRLKEAKEHQLKAASNQRKKPKPGSTGKEAS